LQATQFCPPLPPVRGNDSPHPCGLPCGRYSRPILLRAELSHAPSTMSESDSPSFFSHPSFCWVGLPAHGLNLGFGLTLFPGFPLRASIAAYLVNPARKRWGLTSSCHFSPHMPRSRTPAVPRESHHCDSSVLASVLPKTSPTALTG
jgi:hypothetical protein